MTLADKVTALRLFLAPFFFIVYAAPLFQMPAWASAFSGDARWTVPVLWVLFILSEITDLLDGKIARSRREVSDFGKLFDPFADVMVRITYFLCFVIDGILPALLFLAVLYRELGIQFLRNLMMKKNVVMGARWGGKVKAVAYMIAGAVGLLAASVKRFEVEGALFPILRTSAAVIFGISVILSITSFMDYLTVYRKT
ncbi:MAG: CDP-diacylglycerol--glycerol-3-phosphate 3-phosphatidyltransferase [Spirochaetaceae bacterium]|jgi:CDP-diacylglycerol--glycerol-3-phosphate 3-phosphatidyltransferase|nr:CDP-diacylglycerol--glycerol-3-phosphate 3-phosphatidyltransferase [Spirochaetaceae bacterium]